MKFQALETHDGQVRIRMLYPDDGEEQVVVHKDAALLLAIDLIVAATGLNSNEIKAHMAVMPKG